ncbi:hypothetical protein A6R68_20282 [Neotoma lepida]|uniref:Uncharacterized protein n=1 Tax=Neotoma lepida TaxID=56216 RepID=A0A1A6HTJ2_NEOLE|nr:hypothetical protein A6R68_20282 [Neotoma lepida]
MKLNISFPGISCQKFTEADDECKLRTFYEKLMGSPSDCITSSSASFASSPFSHLLHLHCSFSSSILSL